MISKQAYKKRRQQLAMSLPSAAIALIPAASETLRNGDAHYRFRQDSDFYYLTGSHEPDGLLVITSGKKSESILFNRPKNPAEEQWTGIRLGQDDAIDVLGVDFAYALDECDTYLVDLLCDKQAVYYSLDRNDKWDALIHTAWAKVKRQARRGVVAPDAFCDLAPKLSELRLFKSDAELALMQQAATISVNAHQRVMQMCRHADYEYQLEAELAYEFLKNGCRSPAYEPIVASGDNACILHYNANNQPLNDGDLVLIDAGGEFENYAADITRTFPLNGRFSAEQRAIYELVLAAQKAGLDWVKPGAPWHNVQETIVQVLTAGLVDLGILRGDVDNLIERGAYKPFYMHNSGHWLGLDVHDCGSYKIKNQWRLFEPGMVLTVEPGIYISRDLQGVDERWQGIGVRIEDDISVTAKGYHNLSGNLAVQADELEAIIRG